MEAGPSIYGNLPQLPAEAWSQALSVTFSPQDIQNIDNSGFYPVPDDESDIRPQIVNLGTDQIWRCPAWTLARTWTSRGGAAYTGVFDIGSVYPDSSNIPFCSSTNVCHEGDIEVVVSVLANLVQNDWLSDISVRYHSFPFFLSERYDPRNASALLFLHSHLQSQRSWLPQLEQSLY
jgi:hypothetical protein